MYFHRQIHTLSVLFELFLIINLFCVCFSTESCRKSDFRMSPLYTDARIVESSVLDMLVSNKIECAHLCFNTLESTCRSFSFNEKDKMCSIYKNSLHSMTFSENSGIINYETVPVVSPYDCYDVMMNGNKMDGIYTIIPRDNSSPMNVYCELSARDSEWLVIQRRVDGSEDFYRNWNEYKDGFGNMENEFWLGNTKIHKLTKEGPHQLEIDLEDFEGNKVYALYDTFYVASEADNFQLTVRSYSGTAGDSLSLGKICHNGMSFSTYDRDNDLFEHINCAKHFKGGWWFNRCLCSFLNGRYRSGNCTYPYGIAWITFRGLYYSPKRIVMKIRRKVNFVSTP